MTDIVPSTGGARGVGLATFTADDRRARHLVPPTRAHRRGRSDRHRAGARPATSRTPSGAAPLEPWSATRCAASTCARSPPPSPTSRRPRSTPATSTCGCTCCRTGWCCPTRINLDGIFGLLPTVAWTQLGPVAVEDLPAAQVRARSAGTPLLVHSLDKFPRMLDYVAPSGVRIADANRVRLGAHLAEGTTVMHAGARELQRRHDRRGDGGGPPHPGRGHGRGLRPRRRRVGAGHAVRRRHARRAHRRALPDRRQRRHRHLARRRLRGGGRPLRHGRDPGHPPRRLDREGQGARAGRATCSSSATAPPGWWRCATEREARSRSTPPSTARTDADGADDDRGAMADTTDDAATSRRSGEPRAEARHRRRRPRRPSRTPTPTCSAHVAEAEARRSNDAREVAQRLDALERQVLALPHRRPPLRPPRPSDLVARTTSRWPRATIAERMRRSTSR